MTKTQFIAPQLTEAEGHITATQVREKMEGISLPELLIKPALQAGAKQRHRQRVEWVKKSCQNKAIAKLFLLMEYVGMAAYYDSDNHKCNGTPAWTQMPCPIAFGAGRRQAETQGAWLSAMERAFTEMWLDNQYLDFWNPETQTELLDQLVQYALSSVKANGYITTYFTRQVQELFAHCLKMSEANNQSTPWPTFELNSPLPIVIDFASLVSLCDCVSKAEKCFVEIIPNYTKLPDVEMFFYDGPEDAKNSHQIPARDWIDENACLVFDGIGEVNKMLLRLKLHEYIPDSETTMIPF